MNDDVLARLAGLGLFTGARQEENFCRMAEILPSRTMTASTTPKPWEIGDAVDAPRTFNFARDDRSWEGFATDSDTGAILMLHNGKIRFEQYWLTGGVDVPWISMSVAKSFVSTLVGMAVEEGHIGSIQEPISDYIKTNPGSAYENVTIKDVLQMSSGAAWNEDYSDPESDIFMLNAALAGLGTLEDFVAGMRRESEPGTVCRYNSGETQALGLLVIKATGRSLTEYTQEKICEPLGFTGPSHWLVDGAGTEAAFACLNMTARDFARLGELFRNNGVSHDGSQLISADWVHNATTVLEPYLAADKTLIGDAPAGFGYGYQWWIPEGDRGEYTAIGVYNQFVYVDPSRDVVIVKLSANHKYGTSTQEAENRDGETLEFLRALAAQVDA